MANPVGAPSTYNLEIAEEICTAVATSTLGIKRLCEMNKHWPNVNTVYEWRWKHKDFGDMYVQAKRHQAELMAEEIVDISDNDAYDYVTNEDGKEIFNSEHVQRSRLRVDSRKWVACKLAPRLYGDRIINENHHTITHAIRLKEILGDIDE